MDQWGRASDDGPGEADSSPWASDIAATERAELAWDTGPGEPNADEPPASPGGSRPWGRLAVIGIGSAAIVGVLAVTVVSLSRGDSSADANEANPDEPVPETTLDTLPPLATTTEVPVDDEPADEPAAEANDGVADQPPDTGDDADVSVSVIELPDALASFTQPFELVMGTSDGLATLSFPSGTIRTTGGPFRSPGTIIVAPDATLDLSFSRPTITTRTGEVVDVEDLPPGTPIEAAGWSAPDGVTVFNALLWSPESDDDSVQAITIGLDGSIISGEPVERTFSWTASNGDRIVPDAGGTYAIRPDGSAGRISQGIAVGFADDRLALRSCDVAYQCSLSVASLDGETAPTVFAPGPFEIDQFAFFNSLLPSPDQQAIFVPDPFSQNPSEAIVRANGSRLAIDYPGHRPSEFFALTSNAAWAPDSSGVFRPVTPIGGGGDRSGLVFIANNGDVIEVPGLPREINSIGVRVVESELFPADAADDGDDGDDVSDQ